MIFPRIGFGLALLAILFWAACANPIAPDGGPRDEVPPKIVPEKSTPNLQTNFYPEQIRLTFDEWVKLQDVRGQVIISPPLTGYTVRLKGRSVIVDLSEIDSLRSNVTYVIQFGEAVKDLTESNPAENLRFVFSTGPYIDSLEVQGQVVDAYTDEPVKEALVMLYDNLADSVVRTERPFYFGRTDDNGQFLISNVRGGTFKVFALQDADANYRFNQVNEQIGFFLDPIVVSADSVPPIQLRLFQEQLPLQRQGIDTSVVGQVKLTYNQAAGDRLNVDVGDQTVQSAFERDTFHLWHQSEAAWTLLLAADTTYTDTLPLRRAPVANADRFLDSLRMLTNLNAPRHNPGRSLRLQFSHPIQAIDTNLVRLLEDSLLVPKSFQWTIDSLDPRVVQVKANWKEEVTYRFEAPEGGVQDSWGRSNRDTMRTNFAVDQRKKFGNLLLRFSLAEQEEQAYAVRLLNSRDELIEAFFLQAGAKLEYAVNSLPPGAYRLEVIKDDNANGRWDPGSYDGGYLPERVRVRELDELRANWDLETDVDLSTLFPN